MQTSATRSSSSPLCALAGGFEFDVMLEAKAKDLALIRLRADLLNYAPGIANRFALHA